MTLNIKNLIIPFAFLLTMQLSHSQLGFSHEVGVVAGPIAYQSDFGERYDFETNSGNIGFGIGLVYYMNFDYRSNYSYRSRDNYFRDHFKIRGEISWNKTTLNHYGTWVDRTSTSADKLKAHSGEAQNLDLGAQLEFFPLSIKDFSYGVTSFAPYVSLGAHYVTYSPSVSTSYGDQNIDNVDNFFPSWEPGSISEKSGSTWSIVSSIGTRYNLSKMSDLVIDLRLQSFFDDKSDGLDHQLASNKTNDWLVWLNFGYIHYLD